MAKATSAPVCKICRAAHWSQQPHDRDGIKAMKKGAPKPEADKKRTGR